MKNSKIWFAVASFLIAMAVVVTGIVPVLAQEPEADYVIYLPIVFSAPLQPSPDCKPIVKEFMSQPGQLWKVGFSSQLAVLELWSNWPEVVDQTLYKVWIGNTSVELKAGGKAYYYHSLCFDTAWGNYQANSLSETPADYWLRVTGPVSPPAPEVCADAVRIGDVDEMSLIGNSESAYLIEEWNSHGHEIVIVVPTGETLVNEGGTYKGALWRHESDACALADAEGKGKDIFVVQSGELVSAS